MRTVACRIWLLLVALNALCTWEFVVRVVPGTRLTVVWALWNTHIIISSAAATMIGPCFASWRDTSHRIRCKRTLKQMLSLQSTVTYFRRRIRRWVRSRYHSCCHRNCRQERSYTIHSAVHSLSYIHITTLASFNHVKSSAIRRHRLFKNRWVQTCFVWSKLFCPQMERFSVTLTEQTE